MKTLLIDGAAQQPDLLLAVLPFALILVAQFIYCFPTVVAGCRQDPKFLTVFLLNMFLGWTIIGWILLLLRVFLPRRGFRT
jgi:hypothetical protein